MRCAHWQNPSEQKRGGSHFVSQSPQWASSVLVSTQPPGQHTLASPSGSHEGPPLQPVWQVPPEQMSPSHDDSGGQAGGSKMEQTKAHAPQLFGSVDVSTHWPEQHSSHAAHGGPPPHLGRHAPATHA
jgi:hypothetical protein